MEKRLTLDEYCRMPETNRAQELLYGVLREPPPPTYGHQLVVGRLFSLLDAHVREKNLGQACLSPVAVVLDREANLMVEPDVIFISNERLTIAQDRVWGAPDLIVEVASPSTEHYDRTLKLARYRKYGVRECWLVYHAMAASTLSTALRKRESRLPPTSRFDQGYCPTWRCRPASVSNKAASVSAILRCGAKPSRNWRITARRSRAAPTAGLS